MENIVLESGSRKLDNGATVYFIKEVRFDMNRPERNMEKIYEQVTFEEA